MPQPPTLSLSNFLNSAGSSSRKVCTVHPAILFNLSLIPHRDHIPKSIDPRATQPVHLLRPSVGDSVLLLPSPTALLPLHHLLSVSPRDFGATVTITVGLPCRLHKIVLLQ